MKHTLLLLMVTLLFSGVYVFRNELTQKPSLETLKGVNNDIGSKSNQQSKVSRPKSSRPERTFEDQDAEDTKLPSIYVEQVEIEESTPAKDPEKNIHGVPLKSWVLSQRNAIDLRAPQEPEKMRVYIQCMELKNKHLKTITEEQCQEVFANNPKSTLSPH